MLRGVCDSSRQRFANKLCINAKVVQAHAQIGAANPAQRPPHRNHPTAHHRLSPHAVQEHTSSRAGPQRPCPSRVFATQRRAGAQHRPCPVPRPRHPIRAPSSLPPSLSSLIHVTPLTPPHCAPQDTTASTANGAPPTLRVPPLLHIPPPPLPCPKNRGCRAASPGRQGCRCSPRRSGG